MNETDDIGWLTNEMESARTPDADVQAEFDLTEPHDVLALAELFEGEWYNGGFSQLFCNWYPADVASIPEGLRLIGAPDAAAIVAAAIAELGQDRNRWRGLGHDALLNGQEPLGSRLRDLDDQFGPHSAPLTATIARYERALAKAEGDPSIDDEDDT